MILFENVPDWLSIRIHLEQFLRKGSNMSRGLLLVLIVIVALFALTGCNNNSATETETGNTEVSESEKATDGSNISADIDESSISKNSKETVPTQKDVEGAVAGLMKYRLIYYNVPLPFWDLIDDQNELQIWYEKLLEESPNDTNKMVMKEFLNHYNISREDFDKANLKWAKMIKNEFGGLPAMDPKDYANQETDEVFNGDIIYTFDDEIINNYYMGHEDEFYPFWYMDEYEKAVEEGYTPRTTDWIDVDQMEADIIEKYGSIG